MIKQNRNQKSFVENFVKQQKIIKPFLCRICQVTYQVLVHLLILYILKRHNEIEWPLKNVLQYNIQCKFTTILLIKNQEKNLNVSQFSIYYTTTLKNS